MYGDRDALNSAMGKATLSDVSRNCLDEIAGNPGDDGFDLGCDVRIANRIAERIGIGIERELKSDIDHEWLAIGAFVIKNAMETSGAETGQRDAIDGWPPSGATDHSAPAPRLNSRATAMASTWH